MGMHGGERDARIAVRGHRGDLEIGMRGEEAKELASGVAARAGDGDGVGHGGYLRMSATDVDAGRRRQRW